jgi:hypothetical protein
MVFVTKCTCVLIQSIIIGVPEKETRLVVIKKVLKFLPKKNMQLLKMLCKFLHTVTQYSHVNRMVSANLAIVFAPNLLRPRGSDLSLIMSDSPHANGLMTTLIDQYEYVFETDMDDQQQEDIKYKKRASKAESPFTDNNTEEAVPLSAARKSFRQLPTLPPSKPDTDSDRPTTLTDLKKPLPPPKAINTRAPSPIDTAIRKSMRPDSPSPTESSDLVVESPRRASRMLPVPPKSVLNEDMNRKMSAPTKPPKSSTSSSAFYANVDQKVSQVSNSVHNQEPIQSSKPPPLPQRNSRVLSEGSPVAFKLPVVPPRRLQ